MITANEFWARMDFFRMGCPWNYIAEHLNLKYSSIISMRKTGQFPNFYYAVLLCNYFGRRLDDTLEIESRGFRILPAYYENREDNYFGKLFWMIAEIYRNNKRVSWSFVAEKINVPKTTLNSAKNEDRTLSLDITVRMMEILSIPLQDCVDYLCEVSEIRSDKARIEKNEADILRDEIISDIKNITNKEKLLELQRYVKYLKSIK